MFFYKGIFQNSEGISVSTRFGIKMVDSDEIFIENRLGNLSKVFVCYFATQKYILKRIE